MSNIRPGAIVAIVTIAVFTDMLMYDLVVPFLPQYMRHWQVSETGIGVFFGAYSLTLLCATPVAGWWCNRQGGARPLFFGSAFLFAATLLYTVADTFSVLLLARMLQGIAGAVSWTAGFTLLAEACSAEERGQAMGVAMSGISLGTLIGPPLGGVLYEWGGYRTPFLLATALALLVALLVLLVGRIRGTPAIRPPLPWKDVLRDPGMGGIVCTVVLGATILSLLEPTLPLHLQARLGANPRSIGFLFGMAVVAYGLIAPLAGMLSDRLGRGRVILAGIAFTAVTLPFVALPVSYAGQAIALLALGTGCALLLSPTLPCLADLLDRRSAQSYGTAYAVFNLAYGAGMVVGPVGGSMIASAFGLLATLAAMSGVCALYLGAALCFAPRKAAVRESARP